MALADPIVTQDPSEVTWSVIKSTNDGKVRMNVATDLSTPELMTIRHSQSGKGPSAVDRHNIVISRTEKDSETGQLSTASVSVTYTVPRSGLFTQTEVERLNTMIQETIAEGTNLARLLRGES